MDVRQIMTTKVVTVEMDDRLSTVKEIFDNVRFHHLLVVERGKLCGVLSDRDLLRVLSPNVGTNRETVKDAASLNKRVHQIMTRDPVTLAPDASVRQAIEVFNTHRISCIPIVGTAGEVVGLLSWRDILRALLAETPAL
jgi:acetoin utilization protein AcuB